MDKESFESVLILLSADRKLSKLVHAYRRYSLPKLAHFFRHTVSHLILRSLLLSLKIQPVTDAYNHRRRFNYSATAFVQ